MKQMLQSGRGVKIVVSGPILLRVIEMVNESTVPETFSVEPPDAGSVMVLVPRFVVVSVMVVVDMVVLVSVVMSF
jgi:hypothetical protein